MRSLRWELEEFSKIDKAKVVYDKCLKAGKFEIAKRVKKRYKLYFKPDDSVDALAYAVKSLKF